jgi:hypothetical protein
MPKPSKKISKSSDSDSDDSQDARLREAAVTIDDINKNNEKTIEINNSKNTDDNSFKIEVTPEFQNFVAKKLTTILDK